MTYLSDWRFWVAVIVVSIVVGLLLRLVAGK